MSRAVCGALGPEHGRAQAHAWNAGGGGAGRRAASGGRERRPRHWPNVRVDQLPPSRCAQFENLVVSHCTGIPL